MPRPRFQKLDPQRRLEILELAAERFSVSGYDGASLNQIIADLGISKGAFYYYFDDKEDLFLAVIDHAWKVFLPDLIAVESLDVLTFWSALSDMMQQARDKVRSNPWLVGVTRLIYNPPASTAAAALVEEKFAEARKWQGSVIRHGQSIAVVRKDLPSDLLLALVFGADEAADRWMVENWNGLGDAEIERISGEVFEVIRGMLAVKPPEQEAD